MEFWLFCLVKCTIGIVLEFLNMEICFLDTITFGNELENEVFKKIEFIVWQWSLCFF